MVIDHCTIGANWGGSAGAISITAHMSPEVRTTVDITNSVIAKNVASAGPGGDVFVSF